MSSDLAHRSLMALHRPEWPGRMLVVVPGLKDRGIDHTTVLSIDVPTLADLQETEELLTQERRDEMSTQRSWIGACVRDWILGGAAEHVAWQRAWWAEVHGDGIRFIIERGRDARLLLLEHRPDDPASLRRIHVSLVPVDRHCCYRRIPPA